jgi:glycine cleavage system aminomethyltransferase T
MEVSNYASSHRVIRASAKRFTPSPYIDMYAHDDVVFGIYCNRLYPLSVGDDPVEHYWKLRRQVMLYDVPEMPLEIRGPDAVRLLERVFTRRIGSLGIWRARYAIACTPQGGIIMDGVLIRLAEDHFWYVQANGDFESWLLAYADGFEVSVSDPQSHVLQVQGPQALKVLHNATNGQVPDNFGYFHAGRFDFGGQPLLVSRTGWTGEMGFEIYSEGANFDPRALWDHLMLHGELYGMQFSSAESMGIRRLEGGILDYGTDIDRSLNPYEAGVGAFVELDKPGFVGRDALSRASQGRLLFGLTCSGIVPSSGLEVLDGDKVVGQMTAGAWTPYLETGIGFVRFERAGDWLGKQFTVRGQDRSRHSCEIVSLPFYDPQKKIPRGLAQPGEWMTPPSAE